MQRIKLSDRLELSQIIYGMWRIGDDKDTSAKHVQAKIEACLEQGITSLDQADIYGGYEAEAVLGTCFASAPHLRDRVEIITKCGIIAPAGRYSDKRVKYYDSSAQHIKNSVEFSLTEMHTDHIDLLLIHRPDPLMDHVETGRALDDLVKSGKVLNVGVSNFKPHDWNLLQSSMAENLVTNQIELSVLARNAFVNGDIAFLQQHKIHPMAWSPLGGGTLFDTKTKMLAPVQNLLSKIAQQHSVGIDAVAVAWLIAHPSGILPIMGTNNLSRIQNLSDSNKVKIDRQTWFEIYTAAQGFEVA